jgi:hypothetical protein
LLAVLISYAVPLAIYFRAAHTAHFGNDVVASSVWSTSMGVELSGLALRWWLKQPIIIAWLAPGATLLVTLFPGMPVGDATGVLRGCGQNVGLPGGSPRTRTKTALSGSALSEELGKRIEATIRQLDYPTKNSLKAWHREYEQCHKLRTGYVRATLRNPAEQKGAAVAYYLSHDSCA